MTMYLHVVNLLILLFATILLPNSAFYLPGVAPHSFKAGENVPLKVKTLNSVQTPVLADYYSLPFCRPDNGIQAFAENLGEELSGEKIENSPYNIKMLTDEHCKILCATPLAEGNAGKLFSEHVEKQYRINWSVATLPSAMKYFLVAEGDTFEDAKTRPENMFYELGFPLGFRGGPESQDRRTNDKEIYLNNHVTIKLLYHVDKEIFDGSRIVAFEVSPRSVAHTLKDAVPADKATLRTMRPTTCDNLDQAPPLSLTKTGDTKNIIWTYDVVFEESDIKWASRWDVYLKMTDTKIHWFSIINSLMIVLFLSGMVAMIMMRSLHRDFRRYNELEQDEDAQQEETGWKLVHGDVFRPPTHGGFFSVCVGSGVQILAMSILTLSFSVLGFLSPANRGALMTALVLLFVFMGVLAGYSSARVYKMFGLVNWRKNTLYTAMLFPGVVFTLFFIFNVLVWSKDSSGAVPFGAMFALLVLWFGISVPLVYLGSYFGYKKKPIPVPVKVNQIPRQVPEQAWFMTPLVSILIGGMLPFGAVFIEIFFIMSSIWLHRFYYMFGFLFIVFGIMVLTCAEITIVMCYFQLCSEDYNWWWRSFFTSGSSALYLYAYSIMYYITNLQMSGLVATLLYFGYMLLISAAFFLVTGTVGFAATFFFVTKIYDSIKVD